MFKNRQVWKEFVPKFFTCIQDNYNISTFKKDLFAGITVGIVALPLAMAFGIASGASPEQGIFTAIIGGFLISFLGGSKVQIGGPTGAFVVIIYDIIQRQGYDGLVLATLMAAFILILMGLFRLGTLIKYIPYPLTLGFTTGIAVIIFSSQMKDFLGLKIDFVPAPFIPKWESLLQGLSSWDPTTFCVGGATLGFILFLRKFFPKLPWGSLAIVLATMATWGFDLPIETIRSCYGTIPRSLPMPALPQLSLEWSALRELVPDAMTIALLAAIESLLSAVIADGMIGGRHKSNCELIGQGVANIGSMFFGGIPATAALARTATNIKSGAKTPVAGMIHAAVLFLFIYSCAPLVGYIPLSALSAVLIMVAWNMSEIGHFIHLFKSPLGDVLVLLTSFFLTVFIDITVAVEIGMILAAFLFIKRMGDLSDSVLMSKLLHEESEEFTEKGDPDAISKKKVPTGVEVYEINGPFFFGVADRLKDLLHTIQSPPKVFILRMRKVPVIDASGLQALKEFHLKCRKESTVLVLSGVRGELAISFKKFGLEEIVGKENIFPHIDAALARAHDLSQASK